MKTSVLLSREGTGKEKKSERLIREGHWFFFSSTASITSLASQVKTSRLCFFPSLSFFGSPKKKKNSSNGNRGQGPFPVISLSNV